MARTIPYFVAVWVCALLTVWASTASAAGQELIANNDSARTNQNTTVNITVLDNDQIGASLRPNITIDFTLFCNFRVGSKLNL